MQHTIIKRRHAAMGILSVLLLGWMAHAWAQSSSLYHEDLPLGQRRPLTLDNSSLIYQPPVLPKEVRVHDIITVIVNENSQFIYEDELERRRVANIKAVLTDWVTLSGLNLRPAAQNSGDPTVAGTFNSLLRSEGDIDTRNGMKFKIGATVVDIRPNGNLVVEAHKKLVNNEEVFDFSLTGIVRREDVLPDNTILSEKFAELHIDKRERGHIREANRRGWLTKLYDKLAPF